jgi:hypothetical protein
LSGSFVARTRSVIYLDPFYLASGAFRLDGAPTLDGFCGPVSEPNPRSSAFISGQYLCASGYGQSATNLLAADKR